MKVYKNGIAFKWSQLKIISNILKSSKLSIIFNIKNEYNYSGKSSKENR